MKNERIINRDVSWLEFNSRVLDEAADQDNPLLERLKFLAIFSSNLDEFFMVRMAAIRRQAADAQTLPPQTVDDPNRLLQRLEKRVRELVTWQYNYFNVTIRPALEKEKIKLLTWQSLKPADKTAARIMFEREILPVLTPVGIDPSHPFPLVQNLRLMLLIRLLKPSPGGFQERFAIVEVPSVVPRFIPLETSGSGLTYILAEELIANNLNALFNGCDILECSPFRITRDMDFSIDEDSIEDLLSEMQIALQKKMERIVIRLEITSRASEKSCCFLSEKLQAKPEQIYKIDGPLNLKSLFELVSLHDFPQLLNPPMPPLEPLAFNRDEPILTAIHKAGAALIHLPYESFDPVIRLLEEAAEDPAVLAIKQTLYRVSGNSPIVRALKKAARNGKQVSVLFEIKARFDEENNIRLARELAESGAHVVYGIAGLKVHCKALLIVRREATEIRRYVHLSTGNYNDSTAKQYTDIGYFTDDPLIAADVSGLFNVITGFSDPPVWNKLIVAPFDLKKHILYLIDREARLSTASNPGHIRIKANAVIDTDVIEHLYTAAEHFVKIDVVVRGICGLNPFALSPKAGGNIRIVSIIDRFLEHSRIYIFGNNGNPEYYIGSADLMPRNLKSRIELIVPVEQKNLRQELDVIFQTAFQDKRKGRVVCGANRYTRTCDGPAEEFEETRSQYKLYQFYKSRQERARKNKKSARKKLQVYSAPRNTGDPDTP